MEKYYHYHCRRICSTQSKDGMRLVNSANLSINGAHVTHNGIFVQFNEK